MYMKNLLLVCFVVFALISCSKEDFGPVYGALGHEIKLKNDQTAYYNPGSAEGSQRLQVKLERVYDSRCPIGAMCVTYGSAIAMFRVNSGDGAGETVTLCLGACDRGFRSTDTTAVTIQNISYRIILLEITPHPSLKQKPDVVKEATLIVERI